MTRTIHDERQADLFGGPLVDDQSKHVPDDPADFVTQPPTTERPPDELGDKLIAAGLTASEFMLDLNESLTACESDTTGKYALPSRLFRFPIEVSRPYRDRDEKWHPRTIGLMHPLLGDHPFVERVEDVLGHKLNPNGAPNECGVTKTDTALWWHAVDLCDKRHWRDLLQSLEFTTTDYVLQAIVFSFGNKSGAPTTKEMRAMLEELGQHRPQDFDDRDALKTVTLTEFTGEKGELRRPLNPPSRDVTNLEQAWGRIIGIERGWFAYGRGGHLIWTDEAKAPVTELI